LESFAYYEEQGLKIQLPIQAENVIKLGPGLINLTKDSNVNVFASGLDVVSL